MANKANLTSKIRKCSQWRGDLISCYICNPSVFEKLSPSASFSRVECDRSGDLDETFPIDVHQHLGQCIANCPLQSQSFPSHQYARRTDMDPPSLQIRLFSFLASSSLLSSPLQPDPQTDAYLSGWHKSSFAASVLAPHSAKCFRGCL